MITWNHKIQNETKIVAEKNGEFYTLADVQFIEAFANENVADVAIAMNRTYYAISTMRQMIAAGKVNRTERIAKSDIPYRGWKEGMNDE